MLKYFTATIFFAFCLQLADGQNTTNKVWSLQQCIDQALKSNVQVNQEDITNQRNQVQLNQAKYNRYPNLNGSASQSLNYGRSIDPFTNQFVSQTVKSNNFSLNSNVTLFNGFQLKNTIREDELNYKAGTLDMEKTKNDVMLNVATAYLQVLFANEQVEVAKQTVKVTRAQVERTKKYVDAGTFPESNLLQIKSQLATDKLNQINAENQLQIAKVSLMQLMNIPVTSGFEIKKPALDSLAMPGQQDQPVDSIYQQALTTQPDVQSASIKENSAEYGMKVAKGAHSPRLTFGGGLSSGYSDARSLTEYTNTYIQKPIGYVGSSNDIVYTEVPQTVSKKYPFGRQVSDNFSQFLSLNLSIPIFNNFQVKDNIQQAQLNIESAKLNADNVKNNLRKTIEQSYTDVVAAARKYEATKEQEIALKNTYLSTEKKYNLGMVATVDYLIDKNNYTKSVSDLIQAKYDYIFKTKILEFYEGKPIKL